MANTITAKAGSLDIVLEEGAGLNATMTKYDENKDIVDLAGYTGRLTVRSSNNSENILLELSTASGSIVLAASAISPNITWKFTEAAVSAATWKQGIYNFYLTPPSGDPEREITGTIRIDQGT